MVFSTHIDKQQVHINYISALVSATQHFHEYYQPVMVSVVWFGISWIKMVGYVTKSFVVKGKEFTSQHQTQHTESFPSKFNNIERYILSCLQVVLFSCAPQSVTGKCWDQHWEIIVLYAWHMSLLAPIPSNIAQVHFFNQDNWVKKFFHLRIFKVWLLFH